MKKEVPFSYQCPFKNVSHFANAFLYILNINMSSLESSVKLQERITGNVGLII